MTLPSAALGFVCTTPADQAGYTTADETNLDLTAGAFGVTFAGGCAAGYHGTPSAAACAAPGEYTLSGCVQGGSCVRDTSVQGYDLSGLVETDLTIAAFSVSGASCVEGYCGTLTYTACDTADGEYSFGGCSGVAHPRVSLLLLLCVCAQRVFCSFPSV
jgi:hypothetical protein